MEHSLSDWSLNGEENVAEDELRSITTKLCTNINLLRKKKREKYFRLLNTKDFLSFTKSKEKKRAKTL